MSRLNSISANDLKTKGVGAIEQALADQQEASVTVRGQAKYVVMSHEQSCATFVFPFEDAISRALQGKAQTKVPPSTAGRCPEENTEANWILRT